MVKASVQLVGKLSPNSLGVLMTDLLKKGTNFGAKDGDDDSEDSSSLVWHKEDQAWMKRVEDLPSRTEWWVLIPMLNPLLGNRVI